jgi:hypothetical protein
MTLVVVVFLADSTDPKNPQYKKSKLDLAKERRTIEEVRKCFPDKDIEIVFFENATIDDIHYALLEYRPDIVYFGGHGNQDSVEFKFCKNYDYYHSIESQALANAFGMYAGELKCVILNSCNSDFIATRIAEKGIKYVIGMTDEIADFLAIYFAEKLFRHIFSRQSIFEA